MDARNGGDGDRNARRRELSGRIATLVLADGLASLAGLRGLAARLNTSDRMLLYYFGSKNRLVELVLAEVGARLAVLLQRHGGGERVTPGVFLRRVLLLAAEPEVAPFMRVWTEVIARAARGEAPYARIGREVVRNWIGWIDGRLVEGEPDAPGRAAAVLAIVEGMTLLETAAPGSTAGAGEVLARALDRTDADRTGADRD